MARPWDIFIDILCSVGDGLLHSLLQQRVVYYYFFLFATCSAAGSASLNGTLIRGSCISRWSAGLSQPSSLEGLHGKSLCMQSVFCSKLDVNFLIEIKVRLGRGWRGGGGYNDLLFPTVSNEFPIVYIIAVWWVKRSRGGNGRCFIFIRLCHPCSLLLLFFPQIICTTFISARRNLSWA